MNDRHGSPSQTQSQQQGQRQEPVCARKTKRVYALCFFGQRQTAFSAKNKVCVPTPFT